MPVWLLIGAFLAGCATGQQVETATSPLRLTLPPAALGCSVAVQQRLTVLPPNAAPQELEALLEVDASQMRLALFHTGQRMGILTWDGRQLSRDLSRWWPEQLSPEQVLSDVQLALWPAEVVRKALPEPWTLNESDSGRRLLRNGNTHIAVLKMGGDMLEIQYPRGLWALRIESPGGMQLCSESGGAA